MSTEEFKRKLTAILSADVEGYSRLMEEDEDGTIRTLTSYRRAMINLIQKYRGRVVDSPGDNVLAEFRSVVDAVNAAVELQRELAERNAELSESRRMRFRIGVNLGDVVEEGERIYGDGVNIAARMEALAEGGGICVSGTVYDQIQHKLGLEYEYLGEQQVKNISQPVRVYRVLSFPGAAAHRVVKAKKAVGKTWRSIVVVLCTVLLVGVGAAVWLLYFHTPPPPAEVTSEEKEGLPLPDKPSVAVLPFVNMSDDPEQEYFSDGITEEIITALSKCPKLFVIARHSTFTYKGKSISIPTVGRELGVRYVLEGSVRKADDKVRITAQLIDAKTNQHLWAERYDRSLKDIFAIQDEISKKIIAALEVKLTEGEQARVYERGTNNLEAYLKVLQAAEVGIRMNPEDNLRSRRLAEEAIDIDPNYAAAYRIVGSSHMREVWLRIAKSPKESLRKAGEFAKKALALDGSLVQAKTLLLHVYLLSREFDKAISEGEQAVELDPNGADSHWHLAAALVFAGRPEEAIQQLEIAIRLNPFAPTHYFHTLGLCYWCMGEYEKAIEYCVKALTMAPQNALAYSILTMSYSSAGRDEEARAAAEKLLKLNPKYCVSRDQEERFKDPESNERFKRALRNAGIPDCPPR